MWARSGLRAMPDRCATIKLPKNQETGRDRRDTCNIVPYVSTFVKRKCMPERQWAEGRGQGRRQGTGDREQGTGRKFGGHRNQKRYSRSSQI
jgi:hypothetical protein